MKNPIYTFGLTTLTAIMILNGCESSQQKVDAAEANIEKAEADLIKAKEEYYKEYNAFKYKSDKQIADNKERISELRKQSEKMKKEMREQYERTIADLEAKNNHLQATIDEAKEDSKDGWESFKREFGYDMEKLGKSITDLSTDNVK